MKGIFLTAGLCFLLAAPDSGISVGLIEHYNGLISEMPEASHRLRADALNERLPEIIDSLEAHAVGFYVAPADNAVMRIKNPTKGGMKVRTACYAADGALLRTGDWFDLEPGKRRDLSCTIAESWIFVEWGSDDPAPGAIQEIRKPSKPLDLRKT